MDDEKDTLPLLDPLAAAVGAQILRLREERDLTSSQLAQLASMDPNYLWRIEAGRQNLSLRNVARLAQALHVTLSELFHGIDVADLEFERRPYAKRVRKTDAGNP